MKIPFTPSGTAARVVAGTSIIFLLALSGVARKRHDPLTEKETDQLREQALEPANRFKLYIQFTQARMLAIDQLRTDPKFATDRGQHIHDLLDDVNSLVAEISDNIDSYEHGQDIRKPLKQVVEATADWQLRLRTLKDAAAKDPEMKRESQDFYFVLDTAIDTVNSAADNARRTLDEQSAAKAKKR